MNIRSFSRRWLTHWLTSIALTAFFLALLSRLSDVALFGTLDHLGGDAVVRAYGGGKPPTNDVVLVDLGPDHPIDALTGFLNQIAEEKPEARPLSIGLDFIIGKLPPRSDGAPDERIGRFRDALKKVALSTPVALPTLDPDIPEEIARLPGLRQASVELAADNDGVVRTLQSRVCATSRHGQVTLPSLAAAMSEDHYPERADDHRFQTVEGCQKDLEARIRRHLV